MKIAICADVHIGNHKKFGGPIVVGKNRRCNEALAVLERAYETAFELDCEKFVVAGDLLDSTLPEPQVLAAVMQTIVKWQTEGIDTILLSGNHETVSTVFGDNSIVPFKFVAEPDPIWEDTKSVYILFARYYNGSSTAEYLDRLLAAREYPVERTCLIGHFGIYDDGFPEYLKKGTAISTKELKSLAKAHNVRWIFAGDYHEPHEWKIKLESSKEVLHIVQCGALCPTGFSDLSPDSGTIWVFDTKAADIDKVFSQQVPGPRFLSGTSEGLNGLVAEARQLKERRCIPYLKVSCHQDDVARVRNALKEADVPHEIVVDASGARERARKAASAARASNTLASALDTYVRAMELSEGVDREVVLGKCKSFLDVAVSP